MNGKRCKQCLSLLAMGALVLALLSGCGTTEKDSGGDPAKLSSFEAEVIRLVNEERAEYGLPALTTTDALTAAAAKRAEEISGDYGRPPRRQQLLYRPAGVRHPVRDGRREYRGGAKDSCPGGAGQDELGWTPEQHPQPGLYPDRGGVHLHRPGLPAFLGPDVHWIGKRRGLAQTGFYAIL